jgi:hypothetical protein
MNTVFYLKRRRIDLTAHQALRNHAPSALRPLRYRSLEASPTATSSTTTPVVCTRAGLIDI